MSDLVIFVASLFIATLWHEAAHAAFALATSRGRVTVQVGLGPSAGFSVGRLELRVGPGLLGGFCSHDGGERPGDTALIAAAGPVSSAFLAALAYSLRTDLWQLSHALGDICDGVLIMSVFCAVFTALPISYGNSDSDGLTVLRALAPASRVIDMVPRAESRPERPLRAPFAIVLGLVTILSFMASFWLGAFTAALFGLAWHGERRGAA